jgi:GNAT superfamily N-acetyltransferase
LGYICYNLTNVPYVGQGYFGGEMMMLSNEKILSAVRAQLAVDLNCSADDFDRPGFVFCEAKENPGRRPFPRGERHFEMLTMGNGVIVSATQDILPYVQEQLDGKNRDDAFNMPFVSGQGLYFIPDKIEKLPVSDSYDISFIEQPKIQELYAAPGFNNAIQYDENHPRPDVLAVIAKIGDVIIGMAGASADCEMMWQMGIDVLPDHRGKGLASVLIAKLAKEILLRGKVPYYGTATGNVGSQRVAYRAGLKPAWTCVYKGRFDDVLTLSTGG